MTESERLPFTVLLPSDGAVIDVIDHTTNLRLGLVNAAAVTALPAEWDAPGVYILLRRPRSNGSYHCYVGRTASLRRRVGDHAESRMFYRALLVRRESLTTLHATQINWLEGDLYEMLRFARCARLENKQVPHEDTVPDYEIPVLGRLRDPVMRVMQLAGHDVTVGPKHVNSADPSETTLLDLVLAGQLHPGCPLHPLDVDDAPGNAEAEVTYDGRIAFGGRDWLFPTQAARSALEGAGRDADGVSGWRFWGVPTRSDGMVSLATFRDRYVHGEDQAELPAVCEEPAVTLPADTPHQGSATRSTRPADSWHRDGRDVKPVVHTVRHMLGSGPATPSGHVPG